MQPTNGEGEVSNQIVKSESIIAPLCKVTPVSKYFAVALFIALPFIGAYVGWQYAIHHSIVETEIKTKTSLPAAGATSTQNNEEMVEVSSSSQLQTFPQKLSTTIRYAVEADRDGMGAKNSSIAFDHFWTYKLLPASVFASKEAYEVAQLPYLTMLSSFEDTVIFTASCFKETECSYSGLYSYDAPSKTLRVLESGREFNEMYTGRYLSPDGRKLLLVSAYELRYIDLQYDTIRSITTLSINDSALFAICELGCQSSVRWVDNQTVEVDTYTYEICKESQVEGYRQCGKKNTVGDIEWSEPIDTQVRQYSIE